MCRHLKLRRLQIGRFRSSKINCNTSPTSLRRFSYRTADFAAINVVVVVFLVILFLTFPRPPSLQIHKEYPEAHPALKQYCSLLDKRIIRMNNPNPNPNSKKDGSKPKGCHCGAEIKPNCTCWS